MRLVYQNTKECQVISITETITFTDAVYPAVNRNWFPLSSANGASKACKLVLTGICPPVIIE
jgi:hypothetical protein